MAIYAIGDLHLSFGTDKPMDIFGKAWDNHPEKLIEGFSKIKDDDVVVLAGDLSWAMNFEGVIPDFKFVDRLPGKKLILKGNHDYWWETVSKIKRCFAENGIESIDILHNNAFIHEETVICGTRGWFLDQGKADETNKVYKRELCRLEASLKAGEQLQGKRTVCVLHYPPLYDGYECKEICELLEKYKVSCCLYGHLHGGSHRLAFEGVKNGVEYKLISSDYLNFTPFLL